MIVFYLSDKTKVPKLHERLQFNYFLPLRHGCKADKKPKDGQKQSIDEVMKHRNGFDVKK